MRIFGVAFVGLVILSFIISPFFHYSSITEVGGVKITGKERITTKESSKYLIFTETEVFENTDTLLSLKFNSSDVYGEINIGQTCDLTVNWYRIPFFSMYRNILSAECV